MWRSMSEPDKDPAPEKTSDKADALALGIGCLVSLLLLGAIAFFAYVRGGE
jgi:hypothetical protein